MIWFEYQNTHMSRADVTIYPHFKDEVTEAFSIKTLNNLLIQGHSVKW